MYESFFELRKRPFATMPDADCFVPIHGVHQAFSSLSQCAADGRGIGVLTAPAGLGKSLVCQKVARELQGQFSIVYLPTGNFLTRRSLLQSILFELGHSYVRMGDQELRLALASALRRLRPGRRGIVLIVDEAHLLAPRMLEELRTVTIFAEAGSPVVRLIVSGQDSLEEVLSQPSLDAFNQRIGTHVVLPPYTRSESAEYIERRLAWAGVNVSDLFSDEALAAICEASDGSPRCINQLCDHSLLLGFLRTEKPLSLETVGEALEDLKQLPLTWNAPVSLRQSAPLSDWAMERNESLEESGGTDSKRSIPVRLTSAADAVNDDACESTVAPIVGRTTPSSPHTGKSFSDIVWPEPETQVSTVEVGGTPDEIETPLPENTGSRVLAAQAVTGADMIKPADAAPSAVDEEIVVDRYAALDAALSRLTRTMMCARTFSRRRESMPSVSSSVHASTPDEDPAAFRTFDVVLPDEPAAEEIPAKTSSAPQTAEATKPQAGDARRYDFLFSELRKRRKGA